MSVKTAVELRSVTKRFDKMVAVDDLSLSIREGEFFTLLGASGCGKTTTLRLIAGFELPSSGHVSIGGRDVSETPAYRRPVHTVFQTYALFPHLDAFENVAFPLRIRNLSAAERRKRAMSALEMVQMQDFVDRRPSQLSGGQQQRIALARALVNEPQVLLLDEPLGALDLKLRKEMQTELKRMQRRLGITFVFVTHDQEEALAMSDRIALMQGGKIVQLATPAELYDAPESTYAAGFIGETNLLETRVSDVLGTGVCIDVAGQTVPLPSPENGIAVGQACKAAVRPERITVVPRNPGGNASADGARSMGAERLSLQARVREVVFIGTDLRIVCTTPDGHEIVARVQNRGADVASMGAGADVWLEIDTADLRLLTR